MSNLKNRIAKLEEVANPKAELQIIFVLKDSVELACQIVRFSFDTKSNIVKKGIFNIKVSPNSYKK